MPELKRPLSPGSTADSTALVSVKKARNEVVLKDPKEGQLMEAAGPPRTSNMEAPIMLLSGHSGEIYASKFHPEGNILASGGFDRQICEF